MFFIYKYKYTHTKVTQRCGFVKQPCCGYYFTLNIITLHTLNLDNVVCKLFVNRDGKNDLK